MIKQAYFRGLVKRADLTDFAVGEDYKWQRGGAAALAALIGSKALGAGWGTAAALSALAGTGAYNAHNIRNLIGARKPPAPTPTPPPNQTTPQSLAKTIQYMAHVRDKADILKRYMPESKTQKKLYGPIITPQMQAAQKRHAVTSEHNNNKVLSLAQQFDVLRAQDQKAREQQRVYKANLAKLEKLNADVVFYKKLKDSQADLLAKLNAAGDDQLARDTVWREYAEAFGVKPSGFPETSPEPYNDFISRVQDAYRTGLSYTPQLSPQLLQLARAKGAMFKPLLDAYDQHQQYLQQLRQEKLRKQFESSIF